MRVATLGCLTMVLGAMPAVAGYVDPSMVAVLRRTAPDEIISALVFLHDQVDTSTIAQRMNMENATLRRRHETVVHALQDNADATQGGLVEALSGLRAAGRIRGFQPFWIANAVRVDATPGEITALARRPDVARVLFNHEIELVAPIDEPDLDQRTADAGHGAEIGLAAIRAPEVWALGYTGAGVLVASLDTGVDGLHPALASRWRGVADRRYADHPEWAWFDPLTETRFPRGWGDHGTHTMGTICGGAPGDSIGVAPDAQWIHAAVIDRVNIAQTVSDALLAFEWLIDPDGDPSTNWDVPAVCSNSWRLVSHHGYYAPCDETFWSAIDACEDAGIVIVFAAGNESNRGLGRPSDRATSDVTTFAVGAVDAGQSGWPLASFSSRGPTECTPDGSPAIKPEVTAPGVSVRSAVVGGAYDEFSGTSMATPHIAGTIALMREANPNLTVPEIKRILMETAFDLGVPGEDNEFGWGIVDALGAVRRALDLVRRGDVDEDGDVDFRDLLALLEAWGKCGGMYCTADFDRNDAVDFSDLQVLLANWTGPGPD